LKGTGVAAAASLAGFAAGFQLGAGLAAGLSLAGAGVIFLGARLRRG